MDELATELGWASRRGGLSGRAEWIEALIAIAISKSSAASGAVAGTTGFWLLCKNAGCTAWNVPIIYSLERKN